jgi:hypothetical protein
MKTLEEEKKLIVIGSAHQCGTQKYFVWKF